MARLFHWPQSVILAQRGFLFPWSPVLLALGIGLYFMLPAEPPRFALGLAWVCGLVMLWQQARWDAVMGPVIAAVALVSCGFALAGARTHLVAGPVLDFRYYGPIEGRVVRIDRSASDALRLTLDHVVLERMDPGETPHRVRVSLHGAQGFATPEPGALVILTGHLSAPGGAVEPGGFDFRRHAWFRKLGAVGYTRTPLLLLEDPGGGQILFKARMWLSTRVQDRLPGEAGAFAAAVMTGDRSGMGQGTLQDLRDTNLAHLLAISGLHMGLLAGFVFAAARLSLLAFRRPRFHWPVKKLAAAVALLAAFFYLLLSGGNVATIRAFIMAAVALCALMLNRRALSLRAVAMAALIVLPLWPEALLSPGFQMSFAATTALVAVFELWSRAETSRRLPRWLGPVLSLVMSSAVAGAATAPVGMAHFNQVAQFGLLANLVSVPVMGLLVVPMAVLAALLLPFGLDWVPLMVMGLGLDWILFVAQNVAEWPGATRPVVSPGAMVLPIMAFGALILCLWRGRGRFVGLAPMVVAVVMWSGAERPDLLISDTGALVGVMTEQGRALSRASGSGFVARNWLENDGQAGGQESAAALWPREAEERVFRANIGRYELVHLQGKRAARGFVECSKDQIIVSSTPAAPAGPCLIVDSDTLLQTGALAGRIGPDGVVFQSAADHAGRRLWLGWQKAGG
jgi:competence protein ComEC